MYFFPSIHLTLIESAGNEGIANNSDDKLKNNTSEKKTGKPICLIIAEYILNLHNYRFS
jgi:hypothetical protein